MATVVNNPPPGDPDKGMGALMGAILLIFLLILFVFIGLPALSQAGIFRSPEVNTPPQDNTPSVTVPDQVDVDLPDQVDVNVDNNQ
jgi:hypothetical protein